MFSFSMCGCLICWLNIAVAWVEVVEKSQKKGTNNAAKYKTILYSLAFGFTLMIFVCLVVLGSTSLTGVVVLFSVFTSMNLFDIILILCP